MPSLLEYVGQFIHGRNLGDGCSHFLILNYYDSYIFQVGLGDQRLRLGGIDNLKGLGQSVDDRFNDFLFGGIKFFARFIKQQNDMMVGRIFGERGDYRKQAYKPVDRRLGLIYRRKAAVLFAD